MSGKAQGRDFLIRGLHVGAEGTINAVLRESAGREAFNERGGRRRDADKVLKQNQYERGREERKGMCWRNGKGISGLGT
jgi:hypothetical protein